MKGNGLGLFGGVSQHLLRGAEEPCRRLFRVLFQPGTSRIAELSVRSVGICASDTDCVVPNAETC